VSLTFLSIRIFRTIHPVIIGPADPAVTGSFAMNARAQTVFFSSLVTFSSLFAALNWRCSRPGRLQVEISEKRAAL